MKRSETLALAANDCIWRMGLAVAMSAASYGGYNMALAYDKPTLAIIALFVGMGLILLAVAEATESVRLRRRAEFERQDEQRRATRPRI